MSFSFNFNAKNRSDAERLLKCADAPYVVKAFVKQALKGIPHSPETAVRVEGHGHLHEEGDYNVSSVNVVVTPIPFATPPDWA